MIAIPEIEKPWFKGLTLKCMQVVSTRANKLVWNDN